MKDTKQRLMDTGLNLFHEKGYNAVGIQEITDSVGVSKGSFYNHFKKKERFTVAIIEDFGNQLIEEHREALVNGEESPKKRILNFYKHKIVEVVNVHLFKKGCFLSNMCQEEGDKIDAFAKAINFAFDGMQAALKECLDEAILAKEIQPHPNTDLLAEFILNSWNGALMRVKSSRNEKALDAFYMYVENL